MTLVDALVAAVEEGSADEGKKRVVVGFLREAGPAVERLGVEAFGELMRGAAAGTGVEAVVAALNQREVVGMLGQVEGEMATLAAGHAAELAARAAAIEALKNVALGVVARLVVGVL